MLDTNVIVSGMASYEPAATAPARIRPALIDREIARCSPEPLVADVRRTLRKRYFVQRVPLNIRSALFAALQDEAAIVALAVPVAGVSSHPADDLILATAISAAADFLVAGDRQLLKLDSFQGVAIVDPAEFAAVLDTAAPDAGGA